MKKEKAQLTESFELWFVWSPIVGLIGGTNATSPSDSVRLFDAMSDASEKFDVMAKKCGYAVLCCTVKPSPKMPNKPLNPHRT